jgi:hypothetical protein
MLSTGRTLTYYVGSERCGVDDRQMVWISRQTVGRPRQTVLRGLAPAAPQLHRREAVSLCRKAGTTVTQEIEEVLEMTEIPEEVMQEEGIEVDQNPA